MPSKKKVVKKTPISVSSDNIETLLNSEMGKFKDKYQASMFYIAYKSIEAVNKTIKEKTGTPLDNNIIELALTNLIPGIINEYNSNLKKHCKKISVIIPNEMLCMALTLEGKQCSRKREQGSDLCKPHIAKLVNGRVSITNTNPTVLEQQTIGNQITGEQTTGDQTIDNQYTINKVVQDASKVESKSKENKDKGKTRKGRKPTTNFDPRQYDDDYVTLWEDIVEGEKVLIDANNNVFTFDCQNPVYIGKKDVNIKLNVREAMARQNNT